MKKKLTISLTIILCAFSAAFSNNQGFIDAVYGYTNTIYEALPSLYPPEPQEYDFDVADSYERLISDSKQLIADCEILFKDLKFLEDIQPAKRQAQEFIKNYEMFSFDYYDCPFKKLLKELDQIEASRDELKTSIQALEALLVNEALLPLEKYFYELRSSFIKARNQYKNLRHRKEIQKMAFDAAFSIQG